MGVQNTTEFQLQSADGKALDALLSHERNPRCNFILRHRTSNCGTVYG
jgi:hypothetical protein